MTEILTSATFSSSLQLLTILSKQLNSIDSSTLLVVVLVKKVVVSGLAKATVCRGKGC